MKSQPTIRGIRVGLFLLVAVGWGSYSLADRVTTHNGSVLIGTILKLHDAKLQLETPFAGTLTIGQEAISAIETDNAMSAALNSGDVVHGRLQKAAAGDKLIAQTNFGELSIALADIVALWNGTDEPPEVALLRERVTQLRGKWDFRIEANLDGKTGNSERLSGGGAFTATGKWAHDRLQLFVRGERTRDSGVLSSEKLAAGLDFEHDISKRHSWYSRVLLEQDTIAELDLRVSAAAGYGRYFLDRENRQLRGRIGLLLRHEAYANSAAEQSIGLDLGLSHWLTLWQNLKLVNDLGYTPALDQFEDFRVTHESSLEIPFAKTNHWKLRLGVRNEYNSTAPAGTEKLDTTYFARLVLDLP